MEYKNVVNSGTLRQNLDLMKEVIKSDWDFITVVDGMEGSGKSTLAFQCAKYVDDTFNLDMVCFTAEDFMDKVLKAEKYKAIVYDEARGGMNARRAMSAINNALTDMLAEIRQRNLFIFIVLPTIFDLDKNVACWRARALIHVYTGKGFKRGYFSFYSAVSKKKLYMYGKKFYDYKIKGDFGGTFTNYYPFNREKYKEKKLAALRAYGVKKEMEKTPTQIKYETEMEMIHRGIEAGKSHAQIAELLGLTKQAISYRLKNQDKGKETSNNKSISNIGMRNGQSPCQQDI